MSSGKRIQLLDCTLRDGGYVNDWCFGDDNARSIVGLNSQSGVDYCELAFIRLCDYRKDKLEFSEMSQISRIFRPSATKLAAMVEIGYGYPVSKFPERSPETVDLVRLVVWKRMIRESVDYARDLLARGYAVAIQATRIEQYDLDEFADFVRAFSSLGLAAIYIVDTFGLLSKERLLAYAAVADRLLPEGVRIGYHAHNNMQQALPNAMALCEHEWKHDLILDASVMGIGRGAGNLALEIFERYLNEAHRGGYDVSPVLECADRFVAPIFQTTPWGYSVPYLLSAVHGCNPSYVPYFSGRGLTIREMEKVFHRLREKGEGIRFDKAAAEAIIERL